MALHELRRRGLRVKLQGHPFRVLKALVEDPGAIVTREELRVRLWGQDTNVDFDRGISEAVHKLRRALADSAVNPKFIETRPRVGYRFLASVQTSRIRRETGSLRNNLANTVSAASGWLSAIAAAAAHWLTRTQ